MIFDGVFAAASYDRDVTDVRRDCFLDDVLDKWFIDQRKHFFRLCFCCGKKPSSESGRGKNSFSYLHHMVLADHGSDTEPSCPTEEMNRNRRVTREPVAN